MSDEQTRAHLRIYGKVQGVFFRANTRDRCRERGLTGWVENLRDGSVEAIVEGPPEAVEEVAEWARSGPPRARVEELNVDWEEPTGEFDRFVIRR